MNKHKNKKQEASLKNWLSWLVQTWPWALSCIAWVVVVALVSAFRHHYTGIYGFSTANYGWLAFTIFGGAGFAWRIAGKHPLALGLIRPLLAGAVAFVFCAVAVAATGFIFVPSHPLQGGGDTMGPLWGALHPLGRALPAAEVVVVLGYLFELLRAAKVWVDTLLHARKA